MARSGALSLRMWSEHHPRYARRLWLGSTKLDSGSQTRLPKPADLAAPVSVVPVTASSVAFSDVIGGGLLDDDPVTGECEGSRFSVSLDAERESKHLPPNDRATVLLARLGHTDRAQLAGLRGDALVVGIDRRGGDCDVPAGVLIAACQAGHNPVLDTDLDTGIGVDRRYVP